MEEAKVKKISPGGRCWFGVESKSFELLLESVNGKVAGKIAERGRGCSLWIRFGETSLAWLLEGMEDCIVGKFREPFRSVWNEGGRGYKMLLHNNKARRFLPCSTVCIEEKRFSWVFLEGKVS